MIRDFSPESINPRARRSYAHEMIRAHQRREIPRRTAELAICAAVNTRKGAASGFWTALDGASSYKSVRGLGEAYTHPSWPYPPPGSPRHHVAFEYLGDCGIRNPVPDAREAWPVIRDELAARGIGMHDAGYGGIVAVVLDRELPYGDVSDIFSEYGWYGRDDPSHQTSFV
jgi:hypothetical protein